jgi:hypothetical protein
LHLSPLEHYSFLLRIEKLLTGMDMACVTMLPGDMIAERGTLDAVAAGGFLDRELDTLADAIVTVLDSRTSLLELLLRAINGVCACQR